MFAAFALGAPVGSALYAGYGFIAIATATTLAPLGTIFLIAPLRPLAPQPHAHPGFVAVARVVWVPGLGSALSSIGFGAITAFVTLLFANRGWNNGWLAYSCFATAFIVTRLFFGHLADRFGGARVALICALIEIAGLGLIWLAPRPELALVGAVLSGLGYSLVYPGLGVEAVRRVSSESRGMVMGAYTAFLDLALGLGIPALGLIADAAGLAAVFLASAVAALGTAAIALRLLYPSAQPPKAPMSRASQGTTDESKLPLQWNEDEHEILSDIDGDTFPDRRSVASGRHNHHTRSKTHADA
jgi:predicted MFS family arabinose efflux permease